FTTYLTVIVGELVPKRIALKNPETIACFMAPLMTQLSITARPLVSLLERSSDAILSLLGLASDSRSPVSEDEIKSLAQEAESAGVIKPGESAIISHVLEFGDKSAQSLMTPREKVAMLPLATPLQEARAIMDRSPFRCFPVFDDEENKVVGLIWAKDFVNIDPNDNASLQSLMREAVILEAHLDTLEVVKNLQKSPMHMGMVNNEAGEFIGIITAADVLEALVGAFDRASRRI
ncbi:MAG: CNNM domain-containing protein, partial [Methylocystis sp.]